MDVLRSALGETELTYFGASYGTELGATYAEYFPDRVGRMVLDGAVDPTLSLLDSTLTQAEGFETALRSYIQNCVDEGDCFLGDTLDEGLDRVRTFLEDTDQEPLPTQLGDRMLTEGLAGYGIIAALYSRDAWIVPRPGAAGRLRRGRHDPGAAGRLLRVQGPGRHLSRQHPRGVPHDHAVSTTRPSSPSTRWSPTSRPSTEASPTFGRTFAWGMTMCAGFTARSTETPRPLRGAGAAPIVVIGTTRDPATPYAEAVALADQLESAVLVSRDGDGHTAYNSGNDCVDEAVEDYLVDGTVPQDGLEC